MDAFYHRYPLITRFQDIFDRRAYAMPPADWSLAMTDVVSSTKAIQEGHYKDVNTAGAIVVMGVSNITEGMDFPFVFGGDGTLMLIPPEFIEDVRDVMADTRSLVRNVFNLDLRVGIIPLTKLYNEGYSLRMARLQVSEQYIQAIFDGDSVQYAETLLKDRSINAQFLIPEDHKIRRRANYSGFTCRWKPVPSRYEETISLIVKFNADDRREEEELMRNILGRIRKLFGDEDTYHPLIEGNQLFSDRKDTYIVGEANVLSRKRKGLLHGIIMASIRMQLKMIKFIVRKQLNLRLMNKNLKNVKHDNIKNADFRKFDGTLKMVLSCRTADRKELEHFLEGCRRQGKLFYGIHVSDKALMTCLIHSKSTDEVHFIDAADGGYALASKQLKQQMAATSVAS